MAKSDLRIIDTAEIRAGIVNSRPDVDQPKTRRVEDDPAAKGPETQELRGEYSSGKPSFNCAGVFGPAAAAKCYEDFVNSALARLPEVLKGKEGDAGSSRVLSNDSEYAKMCESIKCVMMREMRESMLNRR